MYVREVLECKAATTLAEVQRNFAVDCHTVGHGRSRRPHLVQSRRQHLAEVVSSRDAQWAQGRLVQRDCKP